METSTTRETIEVPIHSPRWSLFFASIGVGVLLLGGFTFYWGPSLLIARAGKACSQALAERTPGGNETQASLDPACEWSQSLTRKHTEKLSTRELRFAWGVFPIAAMLFLLARRLRAKRTLGQLTTDRRPPVLYLRAFAEDDQLISIQNQLAYASEESMLVSTLERLGPVVAIGKPGAKIAHLGAARLYLTQGGWRSVVRKLLGIAELVVIRVADTPGLRWELATARQMLPPHRLVLWFPVGMRKKRKNALREYLRAELDIAPPTHEQSGFILLNADWTIKSVSNSISDAMPSSNRRSRQTLSLVERLRELGIELSVPRRFRLHWLGSVVGSLWLALSLVVPGPRWSFMISEYLEVQSELFSLAVEAVTVLFAALIFAFVPYIRRPMRDQLPTLFFCTVLALDGAWVVARAEPSTSDRLRALCDRVTECVPPGVAKPSMEQCLAGYTDDLPPASERRRMLERLEGVSDRCWALGCNEYLQCFTLELLMNSNSSAHHPIADLVCAAKKAQPLATITDVDLDEPKAIALYTVFGHKLGDKWNDDNRKYLTAYAIGAPWTCAR